MNLTLSICEQLSQLPIVNNRSRMPVFDDGAGKSWDERLFLRDETFCGKTIHVIGL